MNLFQGYNLEYLQVHERRTLSLIAIFNSKWTHKRKKKYSPETQTNPALTIFTKCHS